jgi:hypothetical protein
LTEVNDPSSAMRSIAGTFADREAEEGEEVSRRELVAASGANRC